MDAITGLLERIDRGEITAKEATEAMYIVRGLPRAKDTEATKVSAAEEELPGTLAAETQQTETQQKVAEVTSPSSQENPESQPEADHAEMPGQNDVESPAELAKSRERAIEIVFKDAAILIYTSLPGGLFPRIGDGQQTVTDFVSPSSSRDFFEKAIRSKTGMEYAIGMKEASKIKEIVGISALKKQSYKTITIPGSKGFMGIGAYPSSTKQEAIPGQYEPMLHSEVDPGRKGKNEPAVLFSYQTSGDPAVSKWADSTGRAGHSFLAFFALPESSAKELEKILKQDPAAMRTIVERAMKEKILKDKSEFWEKPYGGGKNGALRPPYERWDSEPDGGKIYFYKEGEAQPGFHPEAMIPIKK